MWWTQEKYERLLFFSCLVMRSDTLSQRPNTSTPVLQVIRSGVMVGLSLAATILLLVLSLGSCNHTSQ